jgi:hypothetical protein
MRGALASIGGLSAIGAAFFASNDCCERLRWLVTLGLARPGCLGISGLRAPLVAVSLFMLALTVWALLYGRGARADGLLGRASVLGALAAGCGLLLFVLP